MLLWTLSGFAYFLFQGLIKLVSSNVILHWDAVKKDSLAVSQISASFVCGRGHCGVVSNLLSCHLLCLPPPRLPLILPARVEPVSRSACDHGAVPRLSGQAANDIMFYCGCVCLWGGGKQKVTPLVTVTHYLSYPPSSHSESDLIVVMSAVELVIQHSVAFICVLLCNYNN